MIKCVCGADPEVCYCAFQAFHQPPPDEWEDRVSEEEELEEEIDWRDQCPPFEMPIDD